MNIHSCKKNNYQQTRDREKIFFKNYPQKPITNNYEILIFFPLRLGTRISFISGSIHRCTGYLSQCNKGKNVLASLKVDKRKKKHL